MTREEVRAFDEWANADKNRMTREEALAEGRKLRGPPYRMTIEFHLPALTEDEEAEALAQAEYDDDMGNFEPDPEYYTTLHAQNFEDAKREAEERWRSRRHDDDAIGYAVWRADWCCVHSVRVNRDPPAEKSGARTHPD
jgi:hypothetical protein